MEEQRSLHLVGATGKSRTETFEGREHLVVPVVCLIGDNIIHAVNAPSPEYVPASVLNSAGWDGRPLVIGHPARNGKQISANDPTVLEQQGFGFMSGTHVKGKKLGTEAWMDVAKLEKLGQHKMLADARAGKPIEVSVGAYVQTRDVAGKKYKSEWATMASDHLAFLPESTGACSVEMGCGANRAAMRVCEDRLEVLDNPEGINQYTKGGGSLAHENAAKAHDAASTAHVIASRGGSGEKAREMSKAATGMTGRTTTGVNSPVKSAAQQAQRYSSATEDHFPSSPDAHQSAANSHSSVAAQHREIANTMRLKGLERSIIDPVTLKTLRDIPQSERDKMSASDFAGPNETFPIKTQADVDAAKRLIGKATNSAAVKAKIIAIAKRKGLTIPDAWQSRSAQVNKKLKALIAPLLKALDGEDDEPPDDDPDEAAETISYEAMRAFIEQAKASLDEGSTHIEALISENGTGDSEEVEDAHLEALVAMCVQGYGTLNGIIKLATSCLAPEGSTSPMAYMEQRAAAGARHNKADQEIVQTTHDNMVQLGADCSAVKTAEAAHCGCGGEHMTKEVRTATIKTLIENKDSGFTKDDQPMLEAMTDGRLEALEITAKAGIKTLAGSKADAEKVITDKATADAALVAHAGMLAAKKKKDDEGDDEPKTAEMKAAKAAGYDTVEEHEQALFYKKNPEIKALVDGEKARKVTRKAELVTLLSGGPLSDDQLKAKPLDELETLAKFAGKATNDDVDYSGRGIAVPRHAEENDQIANPPNGYDLAIAARRSK